MFSQKTKQFSFRPPYKQFFINPRNYLLKITGFLVPFPFEVFWEKGYCFPGVCDDADPVQIHQAWHKMHGTYCMRLQAGYNYRSVLQFSLRAPRLPHALPPSF